MRGVVEDLENSPYAFAIAAIPSRSNVFRFDASSGVSGPILSSFFGLLGPARIPRPPVRALPPTIKNLFAYYAYHLVYFLFFFLFSCRLNSIHIIRV